MRLQTAIFARKPVAEIHLRVVTPDLPTGDDEGTVEVTDLQFQAGEYATGVVPNPREVGTNEGGTEYRNGVIHEGLEVVALANTDRSTPVYMEVNNTEGQTRIGSFRFAGNGYVDGRTHRASSGWGRPPIITERSDLYLQTVNVPRRAHLLLEWEDRTL